MTTEPYATLLDDFAIITVDHPTENELGAAAFATRALLAPRPTDPVRDQRIDERLATLSVGPETSRFRSRRGDIEPPPGWSVESSTVLLHEGYLVDPVTEGSPDIEKLRAEAGDRLWAGSPEVWGTWGRKTLFRQRCRDILGDHVMPPGLEATATEAHDVLRAAHLLHETCPGTLVVKLPGTGGEANRVLQPEILHDWPERVTQLWADRTPAGVPGHGRQMAQPDPLDLVVEAWLPWTTTYSVSFLVGPTTAPTLVAACEQVIHPVTRGFVGSRSHGALDDADREAMLTHLLPLFEALRSDGYAGVAALDVVIGPGSSWSGRGLALPSGQRMAVIECNPRFNQHNRIGLVVARLARQWDVSESELSWTVGYRSPSNGGTVADLVAHESTAVPPRPDEHTPARLLFAHRLDFAVELTVLRSSREHDRSS